METSGQTTGPATQRPIPAPFGAKNRSRLIGEFLAGAVGPPWLRIYRMLLWVDRTTGLAHCYESDKCQPGKPWHPRSLRFHAWLADQLESTPRGAAEEIDWLFRRTAQDYARAVVARHKALLARAAAQRVPFDGKGFPEPGDDPAIVAIVREVLADRLSNEPTAEQWRVLTQRIRDLVTVENKRKNLVGEGFEDVLSAVAVQSDEHGALEIRPRCLLSTVEGFANTRVGDKPIKVDVAITRRKDRRRTIVTAKWSIRADRERQFPAEYADYVRAKSDIQPFDYVLLTNEFDPARLLRACEFSSGNAPMFTHVVHINPKGVQAAYGDQPEPTMRRVMAFIDSGRLIGVDAWLAQLA
jgi:hypothetical protein